MNRIFFILSISLISKFSNSYTFNRISSVKRLLHYTIKMNINDNLSNINNGEIFYKSTTNSNINVNDSKDDKLVQLWSDRIQKSIAKSRKIKGGNYVQIATVDKYNKPHCRTVVFRGFINISDSKDNDGTSTKLGMKMITDSRSDKIEHFQYSPACEMVWWFSQSSEQYRISGNVLIVSNETKDLDLLQQRKQQWGNLSDPAREQFYWTNPSMPYEEESAISSKAMIPIGGRDINQQILPVPDTFLLLILIPEKVKYLRLRDNFVQLDELVQNNDNNKLEWIFKRVNP